MCGIAGFWSLKNQLNNTHLQKMCDAIAHRGPDAEGFYFDKKVGLGHRRLSIIDLSNAANQPMASENGRYWCVFNGEVYNFKEIALKHNLKLKTTSDTEVILEAFVKLGKSCVDEFNGMFTIVIYDKETEQLHIYRDRMGIKPFYYYLDNENFVFSSELKSIKTLRDEFKLTLNKQAISGFLHLGYVPEPLSLFNEVMRFPAGHYGTLNNGKLELKPYWRIEDQIAQETLKDEKKIIKDLDELINSSVAYRMISDVPFGTFLSGGIDSSLITAMAQKQSAQPINTFSIAFKESKYNESPYSRAVAKELKTNHHEFLVTEKEAQVLVDDIFSTYDEPFADSSAISTMLVSKLAKNHVTMTLSGDGGDELFLGYGMHRWAERLQNPLVKLFRKPIAFGLKQMNDRYKRAAQVFEYPNDKKFKTHLFSQEIYYFSESEIVDLLSQPELVPQITTNFSVKRRLKPAEDQALFDLHYYLKDDLLVKVDRASMKYALEVRVPLLDYRLVAYALNIDQKLKLRGLNSKYILRQVLYQYLPEKIFDRPKWGFGIPLNTWLLGDMAYLIEEWLNKSKIEIVGLFNYEIVQEYIKRFRQGENYLYLRIWQLIQAQQTVYKTFHLNKG
jgi:asparagine synthase (glutamine-hydrolysing)